MSSARKTVRIALLLAIAALGAVVAVSSRFRADAGDGTEVAGSTSGGEVETAVFAVG